MNTVTASNQTKPSSKPWDKKIVLFIGIVGPLMLLIVAGLNERYGWLPALAPEVQWFGVVLMIAGSIISSWALVVNKFFSGVVRIQTERGHTVVNSGPYKFVRHPGYAGALLYYIGAPLGLGAFGAMLPALFIIGVLIVRTALEDQTLQQELAGYSEYAKQTRYRLLPRIW
ncbi:MAG: isoprenylcysteine carboxylmethyltransferase family protein [Chloroflexi bacterium]|nr:isoprenylcysteine carboxylmethyltransferase family protein [Chloroflexota bacterium]